MSDSEENANNEDNEAIENGHVPPDSPDPSHPNLQGNDQFDIDLPTTHRYLGKLDNVKGCAFFEDGEIATMAALQTNTLVFPGFTLPLVVNNDLEINVLRRHTQKNAFVLLTPNKTFQGVYPFGVVMEIFETTQRNDIFYLKARSAHRCHLVAGKEIKTLIGDVYQVTVRVLLEPPTTSPIKCTQLASLKKCRPYTTTEGATELRQLWKYRKHHLAQFPLTTWIYNVHETCFLVEKLVEGLSQFYMYDYIPKDGVLLSFWFAQNFLLRHEERLRILTLRTSVERLRLELTYLKKARVICCEKCGAVIAQHNNVFPMSKDGVQSNYCNPNGYVFETVTVSKATNFTLVGIPTPQFSWFPGYSWTVMQCKGCSGHLGWEFSSASLKPNTFYGLAKSGFDVKIIEEAKIMTDV